MDESHIEIAQILRAVANFIEKSAKHPAVAQSKAVIEILQRLEEGNEKLNSRIAKLEDQGRLLDENMACVNQSISQVVDAVKQLEDGLGKSKTATNGVHVDAGTVADNVDAVEEPQHGLGKLNATIDRIHLTLNTANNKVDLARADMKLNDGTVRVALSKQDWDNWAKEKKETWIDGQRPSLWHRRVAR
jgi:uncharacterized phage infection (PIP) family protein YhgE